MENENIRKQIITLQQKLGISLYDRGANSGHLSTCDMLLTPREDANAGIVRGVDAMVQLAEQ